MTGVPGERRGTYMVITRVESQQPVDKGNKPFEKGTYSRSVQMRFQWRLFPERPCVIDFIIRRI